VFIFSSEASRKQPISLKMLGSIVCHEQKPFRSTVACSGK